LLCRRVDDTTVVISVAKNSSPRRKEPVYRRPVDARKVRETLFSVTGSLLFKRWIMEKELLTRLPSDSR
jgi:uncharacterized protein (DUF111 family)